MRQSHLDNSVKWNAANANSRVSRLKALLAGSAWCLAPVDERGRNGAGTGQERAWQSMAQLFRQDESWTRSPELLNALWLSHTHNPFHPRSIPKETRCNRPAEQTGWFIPKAGASESLPSSRNRRTKPRRTRLRSNGSTVNSRFGIIWRTQHTQRHLLWFSCPDLSHVVNRGGLLRH